MTTKKPAAPRKPSSWAKEARHIGALLSMPNVPASILLGVVEETRDRLIQHLEAVEPPSPLKPLGAHNQVRFIHPPGDPGRPDLRNPDFGIRYCLHFAKIHTGRNLAAINLLMRCLHILERRDFTAQDKVMFVPEYQAMAGIEAEAKQQAASKERGPRAKPALHTFLKEAHKNHPGDSLDELLTRLQGDEYVIDFDVDDVARAKVRWIDDGKKAETPRSTVRGWFTAFGKKSTRS